MQFSAALALVASFVAVAQASPISERGISAKVTLCSDANLEDCDTTWIPIDTCYKIDPCKVESLNTGGHVCDFYSEPGCSGQKQQHYGTQASQPLNLHLQSVFCW